MTSVEEVMRYIASRRKNAADVQVICHDCQRVFFTPSDAKPDTSSVIGGGVLVCPTCGSPSWGIAAVPAGDRVGHRLEEALRSAIDDARDAGFGEAYVNDATGAYIRIRVAGRSRQRIEFEVDRGGAVDHRDAGRLADHVRTVYGGARSVAGPVPIHRYTFEVS